jgi:hypothetical protein
LLVGTAGLITIIPSLGEIGGMVFGLTQIVWFAWLGIVMLRNHPTAVGEKPTPALVSRQKTV